MPNRRAMHQVVRQVWADRERLASDPRCDPGEGPVDWRQVMESLDLGMYYLGMYEIYIALTRP